MNFYYLDQKIEDNHNQFGSIDLFSRLSYRGSTIKNFLLSSIKTDFKFERILSIDNIVDSEQIIIWCSSTIFLDLKIQNLFLRKLKSSSFDILFGDRMSFVYSGNLEKLKTSATTP